MFNYQQFLAFTRKNELARQNRFALMIGVPRVMAGNRLDNLYSRSVSIGGVGVSSDPVRLTGEMIEVPYDRTFSNISLSIYTDQDLKVRRYFDAWVEGIQNTHTRVMGFYRNYVTDVEIYVLDKMDNPRYKMKCFECWPKTIGSLTLDNEQSGFMYFDVTFEFRYYTTELVMAQDFKPRTFGQPNVVSTVGGMNLTGLGGPSTTGQIIVNDPSVLKEYVSDPSAMSIIAEDPKAMAAIAENTEAKNALWESDLALGIVGASKTGWNALRNASMHDILEIPNLVMGGVNIANDTYLNTKYIVTGVSLDVEGGQDTLVRLNDLRNGSLSPSSIGAATQGVSNSTAALGKIVAPINGPASVTPTGYSVEGATGFLGLLKI